MRTDEAMQAAARYIENYGWHQKELYPNGRGEPGVPACIVGALKMVTASDVDLVHKCIDLLADRLLTLRLIPTLWATKLSRRQLVESYNDHVAKTGAMAVGLLDGMAQLLQARQVGNDQCAAAPSATQPATQAEHALVG
jgi:hypothetical protein